MATVRQTQVRACAHAHTHTERKRERHFSKTLFLECGSDIGQESKTIKKCKCNFLTITVRPTLLTSPASEKE